MLDEPKPRWTDLYKRKQELGEELAKLNEQLVPYTLDRLVNGAALIAAFDTPDAAMLAGSLLHTASCVDEAGRRLRRALGNTIVQAQADGETSVIPLMLVLWNEPKAEDVRTLNELELVPVFPKGRWHPCSIYVGRARPEGLVDLVRRYGGDVHALLREKKVRGSKADVAAP